MDCKGHGKRIQIVKDYNVIPEAHLPVLNGISIHSDAGRDITDTYYVFSCISKLTGNQEMIVCGRPTAIDFSTLTGKPLPQLFSPLVNAPLAGGVNAKLRVGLVNHLNHPPKWNKARKQLYNATMLMIMYTGNRPDPYQPLFGIKRDIEELPYVETQVRHVKSLVTILKKFNTTIPKVIDRLSVNNHIRNFDFDLLINFLESKNKEEFIEFFRE